MNLALPSMAKSPAKKSQQISATYLNIVRPVVPSHGQMIATFRCNISQHCWAQHVAPRMLRYVALKCCHRLAEDSQKKDYTVNIFGMHI